MDGLYFYIAVSQIDREMRESVQGADPHGDIDFEDDRQHFLRLRRLFRSTAVAAPALEEKHQPERQPALVPSSR